jgi:hypothetical protein
MPVNLIIRNPLDWDALAIARNANGANRRELSDYVRFLKAQAVWNDLGFFRDFANAKSLNHSFGPNIAFTRASIATYFDSGGTLRTAAAGEPRIDHDPAAAGIPSLGLLIEESRTNSIRNSQAGGVVAGTPGTAPTNWGLAFSSHNITSQIVGTDTENGLTYVDIRYSGTPNSSGSIFPGVEANTQVSASNGQTWTFSSYVKLSGGTLSNVTVRLYVSARDSGGLDLAENTSTTITPTTASLTTQRASATRTFNNASTARAAGFFEIVYTNGNPIDITLRIAAPQLEQGAFATSYIPTTSAAVIRQADSAVVTPISSFYNQSEGTLFAEASRTHVAKAVSFLLMLKSDESPVASFVNLESGVALPAQQRFQVSGGTGAALLNFADGVANTVYRMAGAYALNDFIGAQNGTLTSADTSGTAPATQDRMTIGMGATTAVPFYGGSQCHIRKIAYFPKRLSNALLETLTT